MNNISTKTLIISSTVLAITVILSFIGVGYGIHKLGGAEPEYKTITWDKPTTDAEWAEDTKQESLDFRSNKVLEEMLKAHTDKLVRVQAVWEKYQRCPDCLKEEIREALVNYTPKEQEEELALQFDQKYKQAQMDVEKLEQSIERMKKELELRQSGYLILENDSRSNNLGGITVNRIRKIHD